MVTEQDYHLARQKAKAFLCILREQHVVFDAAYLFGSFAKGTAHPDSDIDIALVSNEWEPDVVDARIRLMKIACEVDCRIEPHPISKDALDTGDSFSREILRSGELLQ